ncbi:MAG: hypothetical protein A4E43_01533 [Methanosaeta sp. PtaB.Bin005]|nr:MAG: hypothetical protein A4E43_01533 [Methanosaeta sp. PtaB.Bin005]
MGEVAAVSEVHAHDGIARVEYGEVGSHVGLGAAMGLDVNMLCAKELNAALSCQILGQVHAACAAIVAFAGIAFGILIGHDTALRLHDRSTGEVL